MAVGCSAAISPARFGPLTTAMRPGSTAPASATTSLIRLSVPISTPLARLTTVASGGSAERQSSRWLRSFWAGMARTTAVTPSRAASASWVARSASGRAMSGRYSGLAWSFSIASATSWRRAHRVTSVPASASTFANVVPHDPAPSTA